MYNVHVCAFDLFQNDLKTLSELIHKWRGVSQRALSDLQSKLPEPGTNITQLIDHLHIEHNFVGYNAEDMSFSTPD